MKALDKVVYGKLLHKPTAKFKKSNITAGQILYGASETTCSRILHSSHEDVYRVLQGLE